MTLNTEETTRPLAGRVAVVTGGSGGIGRAVCAKLARAGASIVAVGRNAARLDETIAEARRAAGEDLPALCLPLDVGSADDMTAMAARAVDRFGRIDVLVTCAGILRAGRRGPKPVAETTPEEWSEVIRTNLRGTFLADRAVLGVMIPQKSGDIINVSSTSGLRGFAYDAAYCASKFAIVGMSEALMEEARPHGIRVQTVLPGPVATGIWEQNRPVPPPEKTLPVERVADGVLYLLTLPRDAVLVNPVMVPFRTHRRPAWRAPAAGVGVAAGDRGETR